MKKTPDDHKNGRKIRIFLALILAVIIAGALAEVLRTFGQNTSYVDLIEYLGLTSDSQYAVVYNTTVTGSAAFCEEEAVYLPLDFVAGEVDKRFYFDSERNSILYALPDVLAEAKRDECAYTAGQEVTMQSACFIERDGVKYISVEFFTAMSDCGADVYQDSHVIWLWDQYDEPQETVSVAGSGRKLRAGSSVREEIVKELLENQVLYVLSSDGDFSCCITQDGFYGYVQSRYLQDAGQITLSPAKELKNYAQTGLGETVIMGWHQMDEYNQTTQTERLLELVDGTCVNVISPTWYSVSDSQGNVTSFADSSYVTAAHELGIKVWALVNNFADDVDNYSLLSSYSSRRNLIDRLISDASEYGFDGINIDFEAASESLGGLDSSCGTHFLEFLRELSVECRSRQLVLSVDNYVPASYNQYYDLEEQGQIVDYVIIMGYDEHYSGSTEAGSVSSYDFVRSAITQTLEVVPEERTILAVPFYTRLWTVDDTGNVISSEAKGAESMAQILLENKTETVWKEEEHQNYAAYEADGVHYCVWMEDDQSMTWRVSLADEYNLAGISAWKLGLEPDSFWDIISSGLGE